MFSLYTLLYLIGLGVYVPRTLRQDRAARRLRARLGRVPHRLYGRAGAVWLHAVSVGEVHAARGLIPSLRRELPGAPIVLSTTTATGLALAEQAGADAVFTMPLDLPAALAPYFATLRPCLLLLVETEVWPNLLRECGRRRVPVALVNARLSLRSARRYRHLARWWPAPLQALDLVCARTETEAARFRALGIDAGRVFVTGNLKSDAAVAAGPGDACERLRERLAIAPGQPLLVAGCTMPGEEEQVLEAFGSARARHPRLRLLLAPRHPERFDAAEALVRERGFSWCRRSSAARNGNADVILLDTIGELPAAYGLGTVSFVGGSLVPAGGHNLLEPAVQAQPVLFGPHTDNFAGLARAFRSEGAGIMVRDAQELAARVGELLDDAALRARLGERARSLALRDAGAGERTARLLCRELALRC